VAFSPVPELNWGLILEEPWEKIASPYLRTTQIAPLVLVPVLLLAILALWFGVRQIVRPLQSLEGLAAKVAEGNIEAIQRPVGGISEIRNLQSELKVMTGKLVAAQDSLHDYIGVITDGRENEKQIIARELHDETLQRLIVLNQRIQLSLLQTSEKTEVKALKELNKLTEQAMTDLRQMIRGLRPISLEDFGLSSALEMLVNESSEKGSVTIKFEMSGSEKKLQPEWELALYRITQEALSNIQRHSRAHQGWLILNYSDHNVQLKIRDDGVGFNVPSSQAELSKRGHYGLLGIQERVDLINARLDLESSRGHGTTLTIFLTIK
jgi:signal transduction histidine kinase